MASRTLLSKCSRISTAGISQTIRPSCTPLRSLAHPAQVQQQTCRRAFSASSSSPDKKYSEDHEWVELDTDGTTGTIGISTYAARALGDVVYVELPSLDTDITKGDTIGAVESVKSASDLFAPMSGKVLETNGMLEEKPGEINRSPEGEAWIARVKVKDVGELGGLMDEAGYAKFTAEDT